LLPPAAGEGFADDEDAAEDNEQLVEVPEEDVIPERRPRPDPVVEEDEEEESPVVDPVPDVEPEPDPEPDPEVGLPPIDPFAAPVLSEYAWTHCIENAERLRPPVADPAIQETLEIRTLAQFYDAVERIEFGDSNLTLLMYPGLYPLESSEEGTIFVYGDNVRIESSTGDWNDVRIFGYGQRNANNVPRAVFIVLGDNFVLDGVTVGNVPWSTIDFGDASNGFYMHNTRVMNGGYHAIYSGRDNVAATNGTISCSLIDYLSPPASNSFAALQFVSGANDWLVEGNVLYGAHHDEDPAGQKFASAIEVVGDFSGIGEIPRLVERLTVTKNIFLYNETAVTSSHGSEFEFSYNGVYTDESDWAIGVDLYGPSFEDDEWINARDAELSRNVVLFDGPDAGAEYGFYVTGSNAVTVSRNFLNVDFFTQELPDGPGPVLWGNVISRDLIQDFRDPSMGDFRLVQ
ncbi:MAG: hypothetical protein KC653_02425, partial [Candidatus Andersenbacteria bacterium]|nr:hypothetical protein [Candidatus Andersenbacteria bacterium]